MNNSHIVVMSVETLLKDLDEELLGNGELGLENKSPTASVETDDEDLLRLLDCEDDDTKSLSDSVVALLESESLDSLFEQPKPEKSDADKVKNTLPKGPIMIAKRKTIKLVRKRDSSASNSSKTVKHKSSLPEDVSLDSKPLDALATKSLKDEDVFVIDAEPDKSVDDVSDLRDFLNRKKRKIYLTSEAVDLKVSKRRTKTTGRHLPNLFPALRRGVILDHEALNTHSDKQQFTLHHLFQKQSPWQFSLDHL